VKKQKQQAAAGLHSAPNLALAGSPSPNRRASPPPTSPSPFTHSMGQGAAFAGENLMLTGDPKKGKTASQTSLPSIVKVVQATSPGSQQQNPADLVGRARGGSVSLGIPGSLDRTDSARFIFGETYITELESENQRLRDQQMQMRMDMEIADVQKQRFGAQVKELRRTCQIYRNSAGDVKEHWIQLEDRLDLCKRQIRDLLDDIQDAKRKGESKERVAEFRVEYAKNLKELQQQIQSQDSTIKHHLNKIDDVMDQNLKLQDKLQRRNEQTPDTKLANRVVELMRKNSDLQQAFNKIKIAKSAPDRASQLKIAELAQRLRQHERTLASAGLLLPTERFDTTRQLSSGSGEDRKEDDNPSKSPPPSGHTHRKRGSRGGVKPLSSNGTAPRVVSSNQTRGSFDQNTPQVIQPNQQNAPGGGLAGSGEGGVHSVRGGDSVRAPGSSTKKPLAPGRGRVTHQLQLNRFVDVDELDGQKKKSRGKGRAQAEALF